MNKKIAIGIIPARYASSRLPGKPLADICGLPMVIHVWNAVSRCQKLDEVLIATDDSRIEIAAREHGAHVVMTPPDLPSGTDRIEAALIMSGKDADIVVNIQGDEPLIHPGLVDGLILELENSAADVATAVSVISDFEDLHNPAVVKVVMDKNHRALYFSRSPVPHYRDRMHDAGIIREFDFYRHIGIYAYEYQALKRFTKLEQSRLEKAEKLEQLRLLEDGAVYRCLITEYESIGIDTAKDLEKVRRIIANKK
ncbi:MAG: 3-deoxy-manno-octulosonate cytidylyltransferase [Candidatus Kapaibacterium sp.]